MFFNITLWIGVIIFICGFAWALYAIFLAKYGDWQRQRNMAVFAMILAVILIVVSALNLPGDSVICPNCGKEANTPYCGYCGAEVATMPTCPNCGEKSATPYCGNCGAEID